MQIYEKTTLRRYATRTAEGKVPVLIGEPKLVSRRGTKPFPHTMKEAS